MLCADGKYCGNALPVALGKPKCYSSTLLCPFMNYYMLLPHINRNFIYSVPIIKYCYKILSYKKKEGNLFLFLFLFVTLAKGIHLRCSYIFNLKRCGKDFCVLGKLEKYVQSAAAVRKYNFWSWLSKNVSCTKISYISSFTNYSHNLRWQEALNMPQQHCRYSFYFRVFLEVDLVATFSHLDDVNET